MDKQQVIFEDLGIMDYQSAWDYQESLLQENVRRKSEVRNMLAINLEDGGNKLTTHDSRLTTQHHLLFVEHPSVYTLGKSGNMDNVLINEEMRSAKGIEFFRTNRGGDITFHGPGQIVGYPILDLEKFYTDIGKYLRNIEEVIILTLAEYGIKGDRSQGETGVWIEPDIKGKERKICAIGVRSSRWITMHGFALNVASDLTGFLSITPCGLTGVRMTSLSLELGREVTLEEVRDQAALVLEAEFGEAAVLTGER